MKKKNLSARFIGKFSSIQSVIFATVAVLILSAVVIVTGVSMKFSNKSRRQIFIFHLRFSLAYSVGVHPVIFLNEIPK